MAATMVPLKEVQPFSEKNMFGGSYRNYESSTRQDKVEKTYSDMRVNQTVAFVKAMREKWMKFDKGEYTIMEAIEMLDELVDDSDPDVDIPNSIHDFQTAERIREQWPGEEYDWFHLVGLHSFYPWHDKRAYIHLECPEDAETLKWVKEFNKFDLYSKGDATPDVDALKPYYTSLLKKYNIDGKLRPLYCLDGPQATEFDAQKTRITNWLILVHFVSIGNVSPLADVQNIWTAVAKAKRAVFIFASPVDQGQVTKLRELVQCMDAVESPPMTVGRIHIAVVTVVFQLCLAMSLQIRPHNAMIDTDGQSTVSSLMVASSDVEKPQPPFALLSSKELGLDGIISGEPQGQTLALILRMWAPRLKTRSDVLQERHRKAHNVEYYKEELDVMLRLRKRQAVQGHTDSLLWDYLRSRPSTQTCNADFENQATSMVGPLVREPSGLEMEIERKSGARRTTSGTVRMPRVRDGRDEKVGAGHLIQMEAPLPLPHEPKRALRFHPRRKRFVAVDKQTVRNVTQMMALKRMDAMACSCMPALAVCTAGYAACNEGQVMSCYPLHVKLMRLWIWLITAETVLLKLTGFQLAFVMEDSWCLQSCGTVPFVAPEVLKGERRVSAQRRKLKVPKSWKPHVSNVQVLGMFNSEEKAGIVITSARQRVSTS
ncbi:unnamed protein product [Cladocopium goreaui]|uniref:Inositol oxygenase n=1 Tax=Cladocopium goreaui TaxID=2562237 RepID=A0A9P1BP28_9DINO|nr:unnamed protein product [Cladocopium goreaui]